MDQATHNKIVSFVWGIADDVLRDLFKRGKYPDVILPMCVIRRLDAVLEPTKQAVLDTRKMLDEARITEQRTALAEETDPNKLHDLKAALDDAQVYSAQQEQQIVEFFLAGADRDKLDPILDTCVQVYKDKLDEDRQVEFKGKAKAFCRTYDFLASVMPYTNAGWEKLSILLNLLTPKLPAPREEDLAKGILEAIDMDSYRVEKKAAMKIALADEDAQIEPAPTDGAVRRPEPELDRLSNILKTFNDHFGTLFTDADRVVKRIRDDIAPKVAADAAYRNARENTPHTARMAHDQALGKAMQVLLKDDTQVYKQFVENESFRRFVGDMVYALTRE